LHSHSLASTSLTGRIRDNRPWAPASSRRYLLPSGRDPLEVPPSSVWNWRASRLRVQPEHSRGRMHAIAALRGRVVVVLHLGYLVLENLFLGLAFQRFRVHAVDTHRARPALRPPPTQLSARFPHPAGPAAPCVGRSLDGCGEPHSGPRPSVSAVSCTPLHRRQPRRGTWGRDPCSGAHTYHAWPAPVHTTSTARPVQPPFSPLISPAPARQPPCFTCSAALPGIGY